GCGHLEGHPDGEGQVGEVGVARWRLLVEVDPASGMAVVQPRVVQGEQGLDRGPGHVDPGGHVPPTRVPICQLLGSPTSTPAKIPVTAATETRVVAVAPSAVVSPVI